MTADAKLDQGEIPPLNAVHQQPQEPLELVAAGPDQKNWRGIGIALLVIVVVCALIVAAIVLLTPGDKGFNLKKSRISLEEVVKGHFSYRRFNGTWISDHEFLFQDAFGAIGIYNVANSTEEVIMSNTTVRQYSISQFALSPDRQYLLLSHKYQRVFRYTFKAAFLLYNISSDYLAPLFPETPELHLQFAAWGPVGNQLVYVLDNNVYYLSEISAKPRQITSNGIQGIIYNGIPDWVYEEEVLSSSHALWWSKDGRKLCFATFNDTNVDILVYPYYGSYTETNNVYPELKSLRYPKAGQTNPTVALSVVDLILPRDPVNVQPPKEYKDVEYYFTEVQWLDNDALSITWLKRSQNTSIISICQEYDGWSCRKNFQVDTAGSGWVELNTKSIFSSDEKNYFLRLPGPPEGSAGRFRHVASVDIKTGSKTFLTSGKYDIVRILAHSMDKKTVFYITTLEGKPGERHLFSVKETQNSTKCYTCDIGPDCLFNDVLFSPNLTYYILECLGPGIPRIEVRLTDTNKLVSILETNDDLRNLVDKRAMPKIKNLKVPIDGNYYANVRLFLPPTLQEYEITKYPMLVEVYGGPGSQMITEKFSVNWGSYLASKKNVIYTWIDGRGSGYQGDKILHELYGRLGTDEVFDQISVTSYLKETFQYIDSKRVAIFGWSYGGYASALSLANDEKVFNCGISVAPVTSWRYYDSVYTERYMQRPQDNLKNYENSDVMKKAANFKGKKYLLIHGSADDNVHWQQSMMLAKALTDAGVIFRMQVYPDENHALGHVKLHLYQTMDDFLDHCYSDISKEDAAYFQPSSSDPER
ncbi:LOW QUALITY PROTEIN: prolyl endopeptidase FAP-like [Stegodyphus dumicola]|uniref:LOW QUALITY PROTEIN: prolyl endopeptidase FAP-like n=1 Tax=Stegodyphus dumicola TaxID=202533 RepID=UPI0015ABAACB|nr:LOW QUALITY PROTEIN: prolyl endopeptidase FAP-like [Stegodyphus dumicola]